MDEWWKAVQARVGRWFAGPIGSPPADRDDRRPPIRFGPGSAVTSSTAQWLAAARGSEYPSHYGPADREGEYDRLQDEIARLVDRDDIPPLSRG
jgi:hypothetical protein